MAEIISYATNIYKQWKLWIKKHGHLLTPRYLKYWIYTYTYRYTCACAHGHGHVHRHIHFKCKCYHCCTKNKTNKIWFIEKKIQNAFFVLFKELQHYTHIESVHVCACTYGYIYNRVYNNNKLSWMHCKKVYFIKFLLSIIFNGK